MKYQFTYETTALDFWKLSMYYTYGSIVGVCNVIFTVAMLLLTTKLWGDVSVPIRIGLLIACCLFTIIQPIGIYLRAKKQAAAVPANMHIELNDQGIYVFADGKNSRVKWDAVKRVSKKPSMLVIFSNTTHGFILTNRVLGQKKEECYSYVVSKMNK